MKNTIKTRMPSAKRKDQTKVLSGQGSHELIQPLQARQIELEQQSEELQNNANFLSEVINHAGGPIFVQDSQSRVILANDSFCTLFELPRDEVIGKTFAENLPANERATFLEIDRQVLADGVKNVCEEALTLNETTSKTIILTKTRYTDESGDHFLIGVISDITKRKMLELRLNQKATTDYLTGVNSRGHFMDLAELELNRALRYESALSLFMMDIDFFKQINDTYGHKVGDNVLKKLAEVCHATLRKTDIIGRVGGEEFAVLLPETSKDNAKKVAKHLRVAIEKLLVPLEDDIFPIDFTVSIGLTSLTPKVNKLEALLNLADKALYKAKKTGRNKVCIALQ
jgi:diguanylate cyclase (GGDEF)-like protein/PAS domain S-box-containing protein